jgi:hypothetical protein
MKSLLLILFIPFSSKPIPWRVLSWSDFKGHPNTANAALTKSVINVVTSENDGRFTYTVECWFVPEESFTRVKNAYVLAHEQLHFDITELYKRKLQLLISAYNGCDSEGDRVFQSNADQLLKEWQATQDQYDNETLHSKDTIAQARWEREIKSKL